MLTRLYLHMLVKRLSRARVRRVRRVLERERERDGVEFGLPKGCGAYTGGVGG